MTKGTLPFWNTQLTIEERLRDVMNDLSLDEKISLLSTSQSEIPRLGIGEYHVGGEAAHGVVDRKGGKTTVFPQPIGLSSTWNRKLLREVGDVIGDEARIFYELNDKKTGLTLWAPTIDMERDPRWGRTEEAYGEDPYLTGQLSTELIKGMQGDDQFYIKLVAAPKHFYGNNNEYGREYTSNSIDPRNRREYYLKAFEPAFKEGKALSMMTAYNGVNGIPSMQINELRDIVRKEWEMDGFIVSDGGALTLNVEQYRYYDNYAEALADSLKKGIDCFVDRKELVEQAAYDALEKKLISVEDINQAIRNMLKVRFRLGHFDLDSTKNPYYHVDLNKMSSEEHAEVCLKATKESIVLLKNENKTLPLHEEKTKKVAVIGPTANVIYRDWYTGYSKYQITPMQGLRSRLKNADIHYVSGHDQIALKSLKTNKYVTVSDQNLIKVNSPVIGLHETFEIEEWGWNSNLLKNMAGNKYISQIEKKETFEANNEEAFGWFVKEKIHFQPISKNEQIYHLSGWNGQPLSVSNQDELIMSDQAELFEKKVLTSGIEEAVKLAKSSDVAIVFVGNNPMLNGREIEDRPDIILPERQQQLVEAVYEANPNTIVVVIGSYPFALDWIDKKIPAILYSSHGSQMLGEGVASILYGDESPSGRLSMTWYKDITQLPSLFDYDIIKGNRTYMYFDEEVLYPFGHGLSYTTFEYSSIQVSSQKIKDGEEIKLSLDIENTGEFTASEVIQIYATVQGSKVKRPKKLLVNFDKVVLLPSQKQRVDFTIKAEQLSFWDVDNDDYCFESGTCILSVGPSSNESRLSKRITMEGKELSYRSLTTVTKAENYNDYHDVYLSKGVQNLNCVTNSGNGWICFKNVQISKESGTIQIQASVDGRSGKVSVMFDHLDSEVIAVGDIVSNDSNQWNHIDLPFVTSKGVHDVYIFLEGAVSITTVQIF
ncbi:glycoside hydrolase family 3 C-terminal domain-containing protein [Litchfieldia salsa]|uniref:Exo-1,4-beta-glucosidase n=1 Tax=Litchfieldia salsa TaxID=930152 RepID=A0A1H0Q865_9BACI|nr:glycoside hydrolase family 3 C-terminal domain-containing protein [Litchfieldia salsa]SDP13400.1 exo-1,4-beta-glucosidase [Litchfieldia salsa]